jgi:hypothetical protein
MRRRRRRSTRKQSVPDELKSFLSPQGDFAPFLELDHLRVMVAQPEYLLVS